ncbi:RagB/SusD family nutrient uptake outer membrane protein [Gemmatimonas sp.]|uniref:RagB/SusD family nutrient uptake outer membrane protein n=1 Tax=Gemmatimonas sp. TaxID=1962908 RepID=UPI003983974B
MTTTYTVRTAGRVAQRGLALVAVLGGLSACDLSVSNPGPTQDAFLADSLSLTAQVAGVGYTLGDGMNYVVLHSAVATRELFPTGQSGQFGVEPRNWVGQLVTEEQGTPWNLVSRARWLGDQAVARLQTVLGPTAFAKHPQAAQALIWRGFTYRVLGEAMCVSIINGGPATPARDNLVRAESTFTAAITVATAANNTTLINAAYAGRAQVRVALADWAGAVSDAGRVPTSFSYKMPYYANVDEFGYNRTMWSSTAQSFYKATSAWNTWYAQYFDETRDPRVPYTLTALKGSGAFPPVGAVNWWPQAKYVTNTAGVNLTSGREARLIEAEAALRSGNVVGAMTLIDANRASAGASVAARPATLADAWTLLKRERGIELWLEGRRLADLRRWAATSTPGSLDPKEVPGAASYLEAQSSCFPVSRQEIDTNKNNVGTP